MKQIKFDSHEQYLEVQRQTVRTRGIGPYFTDLEMKRIADWCKANGVQVVSGICHGARNGLECDELMRYLPLATIMGTDLFPNTGKSRLIKREAEVIEWDFNEPRKEWERSFDLVYSNSLDHSPDPEETLKVWFRQLKPLGAMFVQWNRSDETLGGGDCFAASLPEYLDLLNSVGQVQVLIYVNSEWEKGSRYRRHALEAVVIVVRHGRVGNAN